MSFQGFSSAISPDQKAFQGNVGGPSTGQYSEAKLARLQKIQAMPQPSFYTSYDNIIKPWEVDLSLHHNDEIERLANYRNDIHRAFKWNKKGALIFITALIIFPAFCYEWIKYQLVCLLSSLLLISLLLNRLYLREGILIFHFSFSNLYFIEIGEKGEELTIFSEFFMRLKGNIEIKLGKY